MEDRHVTLSEIAPGVFYSAVFDGHGGPKTAEFAQQHLQTMIRNRDSLTGTQQRFRNFWKFSRNFEKIPLVNPKKEIRIFSKNEISLEPVSKDLF